MGIGCPNCWLLQYIMLITFTVRILYSNGTIWIWSQNTSNCNHPLKKHLWTVSMFCPRFNSKSSMVQRSLESFPLSCSHFKTREKLSRPSLSHFFFCDVCVRVIRRVDGRETRARGWRKVRLEDVAVVVVVEASTNAVLCLLAGKITKNNCRKEVFCKLQQLARGFVCW